MRNFAFFVTVGSEKYFHEQLAKLKSSGVNIDAYPALDNRIKCGQYDYGIETDSFQDAVTAIKACNSFAYYPIVLAARLEMFTCPAREFVQGRLVNVEVPAASLAEALCAVRDAEALKPLKSNYAVYEKDGHFYMTAAASVKSRAHPNLDYWQKSLGDFCRRNGFGQPCFRNVWIRKV